MTNFDSIHFLPRRVAINYLKLKLDQGLSQVLNIFAYKIEFYG